MLGCWEIVDAPDGVHCIPEDDLILHAQSESCFCAPVVETQAVHQTEYLWLRKLIVHTAMDGRE